MHSYNGWFRTGRCADRPAMVYVHVRNAAKKRVIAVVDDEATVREAAANLLRSAGFSAECFASAEEFLDSPRFRVVACLVLDVALPGMNGLQLQQRLLRLGLRVPIIFITASADGAGRMRAQALRAGALAFLSKPFLEQELLSAVRTVVRA